MPTELCQELEVVSYHVHFFLLLLLLELGGDSGLFLLRLLCQVLQSNERRFISFFNFLIIVALL